MRVFKNSSLQSGTGKTVKNYLRGVYRMRDIYFTFASVIRLVKRPKGDVYRIDEVCDRSNRDDLARPIEVYDTILINFLRKGEALAMSFFRLFYRT